MNTHVKRFTKCWLRLQQLDNDYNRKMFGKALNKIITQFTYKHKIDPPERVEGSNLIFGNLSIPIQIVVTDVEKNAPNELIWDYVDLCLEGLQQSYLEFIQESKNE
jgi:hypothetical protein